MGLIILFGIFFLGLLVGTPVAFAVGLAAVVTFLYEGLPLFVAFQRILSGVSVFSLLAIPFFIFAGELMMHGGISNRLVRLASAMVGKVRGGLGMVNISSSMLFGGISGSAVADTSALGSILIPVMKEKGYDADYAVNVTVTSSVAGVVIPPSHNMILYAVAAGGGISVTQLFIAGIVPGVLMCLSLAVAAYVVAVKRGYKGEAFPGWYALMISFFASIPGLMTAVIIVGGVLSGILTVTESGAFGAIYAIVVTGLVYRELTWASFKAAVVQSVKTTSLVMILVGCASAFSYLLALYNVPEMLTTGLMAISDKPVVIFLMLNIILLILGMIMDMAALILICTPIFLPVAMQFGMDPIQFGIILMMNLGLGLCTPPVGACLFVGCVIGKIKIEEAVRTIWPFFLALFAALMLVTYVPAISLTLPSFFQ
ncbi:TRAP transporter large permease [Vreelandella arcis]|uniref:TRAP transporter large permease protein n=1 Tax=Vreelandella arcis TaxID=416873 RepID=A0A1H0H0J1_9GAMM|nr:TRAP transporter large permease [Halomonas arcis]SDO12645.1 TRAP transporter, DctM subunit [Halomonas arcis]